MPEPAKRDPNAPKFLEISVKDTEGNEWKKFFAQEKLFSSGSVGFYASEKIENPASHEKYQVGMNITLVGSKPKA
ncbi:MAG: hypothetical protein Ta2B_04010 [Termitinemataceae bacterium]|nr:MAG: hypothetical protein Ta2B_04010 [Termitinemataceae bacterium]